MRRFLVNADLARRPFFSYSTLLSSICDLALVACEQRRECRLCISLFFISVLLIGQKDEWPQAAQHHSLPDQSHQVEPMWTRKVVPGVVGGRIYNIPGTDMPYSQDSYSTDSLLLLVLFCFDVVFRSWPFGAGGTDLSAAIHCTVLCTLSTPV